MELHSTEYASLTVIKLREELRHRHLKTSGRKVVLISRLEESDTERRVMAKKGDIRERTKNNNGTTHTPMQQAHTNNSTHKSSAVIAQERNGIVLWKRPHTTIYYFILESLNLLQEFIYKLWQYRVLVSCLIVTFLSLFFIYHKEGEHQVYVSKLETKVLWCLYWIGLGVLSSVGLGTGLHTFVLYLGPHIASVTLGAFECMSVDFPSPPYPDDIVCPDHEEASMSLWTIMGKVRLEAFMWGAGTAIGELPPYFMARAARLSGQIDEEEQELEELIEEGAEHPSNLNFLQRAKIGMHNLVQKVGFVGILLCASIPNPLFDLAGITCGHFLVPFWTFFGATLIGKAVIKMHIQKLFVIFVFSEHHVEQVISLLKYIPYLGKSLQQPFKEYLHKQKTKMHKGDASESGDASLLSWVFEKLVLIMVAYFLLSIVNSMAQSYHKRLTDRQRGTSDSSRAENKRKKNTD